MMKIIPGRPKEFSLQEIPAVIYSALVHSPSDSFTIVDRSYRILWTSQLRDRNRTVGKVCYEVVYQRNSPCPDPNCVVKNIFNHGKVCTNEKCIHRQDGSQLWKEVRAYPVFDNQGNLMYSLSITHDVTEKRLEVEKQRTYVRYLEKTLHELSLKNNDIAAERQGSRINLTGRELEILRLMAEGCTNIEIARMLAVSPHTVKSHIVHVFDKLGVNDRTQAAVQATRLKLI